MNDLLSRYADCLFWFGRYTERTACLARILEVQTSFTRGRTQADTDWRWILTLYDDETAFAKLYDTPDANSVAKFYVTDRRNPASLISCIHIARENARTLRAHIPTDLWLQINAFYNRFKGLHASFFSAAQMSSTCQMVKKESYAQVGVAEATLSRGPAWTFFTLGVLIERADQMSRLLDVRFAQMRSRRFGIGSDSGPPDDFTFWSVLLRSAAAHQAYLRVSAGHRDPESVARFFIFNSELPRSIAYCVCELNRLLNELRSSLNLQSSGPALAQIDALNQTLSVAAADPELLESLHQFNDQIQTELLRLTDELSYAFFGAERPEPAAMNPNETGGSHTQSQSQTWSQSQTQSQSRN